MKRTIRLNKKALVCASIKGLFRKLT